IGVNHAASVQGRERLRLFCALRLPDEVVDALVEWGGRHLAARVVPRANLHITLAFLGHRPAEELEAILAATGAAATAAQPIGLDLALGIGGLPRGRIVEVFGPESSGKTTLVYHVIAEAQRRGGITAFIDAEHAMDPTYAKRIGVNIDDLLVSQPDTGEQAL